MQDSIGKKFILSNPWDLRDFTEIWPNPRDWEVATIHTNKIKKLAGFA